MSRFLDLQFHLKYKREASTSTDFSNSYVSQSQSCCEAINIVPENSEIFPGAIYVAFTKSLRPCSVHPII